MKRLLYLLVFCLILISPVLTSCSDSSSPVTTRILVATDATWPPFESVNKETQIIEGLDIDIMKAIAARQNLEVEFKNVLWDPLLAGMAQGKYDAAISSITITDERKKDMLFSDPYFSAGQMVVIPITNVTITGKDKLNGPVGVLSGSTGDIEVKKIKSATPIPYEKIEMAFEDLMQGKINAVVYDNPVALLYVGKNPDKLKTAGSVFTDEKYGIAVARDKKDLLKKIDAGLKAVKSENLIEQLSQKWLK
jgi:polar amino acid transport system substrate-binding protein